MKKSELDGKCKLINCTCLDQWQNMAESRPFLLILKKFKAYMGMPSDNSSSLRDLAWSLYVCHMVFFRWCAVVWRTTKPQNKLSGKMNSFSIFSPFTEHSTVGYTFIEKSIIRQSFVSCAKLPKPSIKMKSWLEWKVCCLILKSTKRASPEYRCVGV